MSAGPRAGAPGDGDAGAPREPPHRLAGILRRLGPGLIVAGSIVGSGELIATTRVGAESGFTLLWLILLGCVIKVFCQLELGRYALTHGGTGLDALERLPGPRLVAGWGVWAVTVMLALVLCQQGGIVGGVGQALSIAAPVTSEGRDFNDLQDRLVSAQVELALAESLPGRGSAEVEELRSRSSGLERELEGRASPRDPVWWAGALALLTAALLVAGRYGLVQAVATTLVAAFTAVTVFTLCALQLNVDWAVTGKELLDGLSFRLPARAAEGPHPLATALAAFGIIGVGAAELVTYPYWCLEKGYARWTGPTSADPAWAARARGWLRVMRVDAWLSAVVYTLATVAFYLLGAAVLGRVGLDPGGDRLVRTLTEMYAPVFGGGAQAVFLVGAFCVLYSTFFVGCASMARLAADVLRHLGLVRTERGYERAVRVSCALIPVVAFVTYAWLRAPAKAVLWSGVAQALLLPVLGAAALLVRHRHPAPGVPRTLAGDVALWVSFAGFAVAGSWLAWSRLAG